MVCDFIQHGEGPMTFGFRLPQGISLSLEKKLSGINNYLNYLFQHNIIIFLFIILLKIININSE